MSVTTLEYEAIRTAYSDFDIPEESGRIQITELTNLTAESLRSAVHSATVSDADDLIVIRTTSEQSTVSLADGPLVLNLSDNSGRLVIVVYGEASLQLVGTTKVIEAVSGDIALGGMTLVGMTDSADVSPSDLLTVTGDAKVETARFLYLTKPSSGSLFSSSTTPVAMAPTGTTTAENAAGENTAVFSLTDDTDRAQSISMEFRLTETRWVYMTGLTAQEASDYQTTIYALSENFYVSEYYDINKYWDGDSQLCWAAAMANILYYTGWASEEIGFYDAQDTYYYFKTNFTNVGGHLFYGSEWFLTGEYAVAGMSGWAQPLDETSGGFYPNVSVSSVREYIDSGSNKGTIVQKAGEYLRQGYGVAAALGWYSTTAPTGRHGGHSITMWGYVYDTAYASDSPYYYSGLIVTDSDDHQTARVQLSLEWSEVYNQYRFSDYSSKTGWLEDLTCLAPNPESQKIPLATPELGARASGLNVVTEWAAVEDATDYHLRYRRSDETEWMTVELGDVSLYVFSDLAFGTEYEFQIQAFDSAGLYRDSDWSEIARAKTLLPLVVSTEQDVVNAEDEFLSLREAIAYAESGLYGKTITFDTELAGKTVTLSASAGAIVVAGGITIDASAFYDIEADAPGITLDAGGESRVLEISGGSADSPVRLIGLTVIGGQTDGIGGGIFATDVLSLESCHIADNRGDSGGGIAASGTLFVRDSRIMDNAAVSQGGGILSSGILTVENSLIINNSAASGGGIESLSETAATTDIVLTLRDTVIMGNRAELAGGGIKKTERTGRIGGRVVIEGSFLQGNFVSADAGCGGGISLTAGFASFWIDNSLITDNIADNGAGIYLAEGVFGSSQISNSTVTKNTAFQGGGIYAASSMTVANSIIALNSTSVDGMDVYDSGEMIKAYSTLSTVEKWDTAPHAGSNYLFDATLPLFVNAEAGDYRLVRDSQAVNKGDTQYAVATDGTPLKFDLAGNPRLADSAVDLGAYEYRASLEVQLVVSAAPSASNSLETLDSSLTSVDVGNPFYVEIWLRNTDAADPGIKGAYLDVLYNTDAFHLTAVSFSSLYNEETNADLSVAGQIGRLGGTDLNEVKTSGQSSWARLASLNFTAVGAVSSSLFETAASDSTSFLRFNGESVMAGLVDFGSVALSVKTTLIGDIDSDGFVGPNDYRAISIAWFSRPSSDHWNPLCDLDGDGFIGPNDFRIMSLHWFTTTASSTPEAVAAESFLPNRGMVRNVSGDDESAKFGPRDGEETAFQSGGDEDWTDHLTVSLDFV